MMLSGPSPGTEHYKEATLFISRVLDGASISPRSMESLAINRGVQEEWKIKGERGKGGGMIQKEKQWKKVRVTAEPET